MRLDSRSALVHAKLRGIYVIPERESPLAPHVPAGRTLHLIDLENLTGGAFKDAGSLRRAWESYQAVVPIQLGDHVILASNPAIGFDVGLLYPRGLLKVRHGPDGADQALLNEVRDREWIASRFHRVVVGSGDGIFLGLVNDLRRHGVAVGIVSLESGLSWQLSHAAHFVRLLHDQSDHQVSA